MPVRTRSRRLMDPDEQFTSAPPRKKRASVRKLPREEDVDVVFGEDVIKPETAPAQAPPEPEPERKVGEVDEEEDPEEIPEEAPAQAQPDPQPERKDAELDEEEDPEEIFEEDPVQEQPEPEPERELDEEEDPEEIPEETPAQTQPDPQPERKDGEVDEEEDPEEIPEEELRFMEEEEEYYVENKEKEDSSASSEEEGTRASDDFRPVRDMSGDLAVEEESFCGEVSNGRTKSPRQWGILKRERPRLWGRHQYQMTYTDLLDDIGSGGNGAGHVTDSGDDNSISRSLEVDQDKYWSRYPSLNESFNLDQFSQYSLPGFVKQKVSLMGSSVAEHLEEEWKKLVAAETQVKLMRAKLIKEQTEIILKAFK